ncbi:hypothetical protein L484_005420 [Morus notabilis]|uniref:Pre-rRNA-processing protein TSR2-like protein n=1 Tax=Morus notabilis TaxID=981085 RepID=W9R130_9ROSA|nr:pre-rRNA-processing protein TSR2 homolog [Morus notabilis]EXB63457.1 hypothetical protein L484_005420 [Morus notabilis]
MESMNDGRRGIDTTSVAASTLQKPEAFDVCSDGGGSPHLRDSVASILSRWNGLQMAVQNQWGGHDSLNKSHQLADDISSWFSQSKAPLYVEDVENLLHENMLLSFNTDIEDGSVEEVAEQLMDLHEEYLHGSQVTM